MAGPKKSQGSGGFNGDDSIDLACEVRPVSADAKDVGNEPNEGVGLIAQLKGAE